MFYALIEVAHSQAGDYWTMGISVDVILLLIVEWKVADVELAVGVILSSWNPENRAISIDIHPELMVHQRIVVNICRAVIDTKSVRL